MIKLTARQKIAAARKAIIGEDDDTSMLPAYHPMALSLVPLEVDKLGTCAITDKGVFMYDPEYVANLPLQEMTTLLLKFVTHLLRNHGARIENVNARTRAQQEKWGKSCSMTTNVELHKAGCKHPAKAVFPKQEGMPEGMLPEEYYRMIEDRESEREEQDGEPSPGAGDSEPGDPDDCIGSGNAAPDGWNGSGGSGMGCPLPQEKAIDPELGRGQDELEDIREETARQIRERAKHYGNVPDSILRWCSEQLKPSRIPWRQRLSRIIRNTANKWTSGKMDFRFDGLSRKQGGLGYGPGVPILPRLRAPVIKADMAFDTSYSMQAPEFQQVMPEANAVLKAIGASCRMLACDAEVHVVKNVSKISDVFKNMTGGGGTSFIPIFETIAADKKNHPDLLIIFTDGYGPAPAKPPPYPVIWVLVGRDPATPCDWGECIKIEEEDVR